MTQQLKIDTKLFIIMKENIMKLKYLDTAGEEDYQNMIDMWLSFAEGFLLVFTIDNKESFENIKTSRELILRYKKNFQ